MFTHRTAASLAAYCLLAALAATVNAEEKPDPATKPLTAEQCEKLVEQLVNPGKPPFDKLYVDELPKGVTIKSLVEGQKEIRAAYNELSDNIEAALPVLVNRVSDKRFSYVYESGSGYYVKATVGYACRQIVTAHVEIYRKHATGVVLTAPQCMHFIDDECGGFEKWWKDREGKSLAELQLEGIVWAMSQEKPGYFTERQWAAAKKALEQMAKEIRVSKKPVLMKHKLYILSP
jgi:hypothetical protein